MAAPRPAFFQIVFPLLLALVIGVLAGFGALFFRWLIGLETALFWPGGTDFLSSYQQAPWYLRLIMPVLAGLMLGPLLAYVAPEIKGPGVPEVMAALAMRDGIIRHRVTVAKSLATATFIAAGCSLGREGPIVQIGASIGSSLTQFFRLGPVHRRMAVACGAAAGIAATFHAPMAGTLFVVEILLFDLEIAFLANIVIAAVTGTVVAKFFGSGEALFQAHTFVLDHSGELVLYGLLGLAAGLFSLLFMAIVFAVSGLLERGRVPAWFAPTLGGVVVGVVGLFYPQALSVGYETVNQALQGNVLLATAAILLVAKLVATSACVGSGMSGGIFAPSLFLGAMLGLVFGHGAQLIWPEAQLAPVHYGLVGMGAVVAGTTLAPITAILTIFELTYNYEVVLPLMVACIPSIIVVRLLHGYSIYETKLLMAGIRIVRGHDANRLRAMKVADYLCRDFTPLADTSPFCKVVEEVLASPFPHFVVLDEAGLLAGVLTLRDVRAPLADPNYNGDAVLARDLMQSKVTTVREDENLEDAFHLFASQHFSFLPVVARDNPRQVVGCLKKDDLVTAYNQHVLHDQVQPVSSMVCRLPVRRKS
ncbi:MAG: chloride channel protein [Desulfobulbaceae bacterium]|nr:MAG: chloride channel protein [Desulfobulbaceae bacterium]